MYVLHSAVVTIYRGDNLYRKPVVNARMRIVYPLNIILEKGKREREKKNIYCNIMKRDVGRKKSLKTRHVDFLFRWSRFTRLQRLNC